MRFRRPARGLLSPPGVPDPQPVAMPTGPVHGLPPTVDTDQPVTFDDSPSAHGVTFRHPRSAPKVVRDMPSAPATPLPAPGALPRDGGGVGRSETDLDRLADRLPTREQIDRLVDAVDQLGRALHRLAAAAEHWKDPTPT